MGRDKKAARTKGNKQPSSSGRSADLLGGTTGFIGFGALNDLGYVPATSQGLGAGDDSAVSASLRVALRKMTKKDATTKIKALQEFEALCREEGQDATITALPFWPRLYGKLALDSERRVREATQQAHRELVKQVGRQMAPHLKAIMPTWAMAICDPHPPAANTAAEAFKEAFSRDKRAEVILFTFREIVNLFVENLFVHTPQTLSDPKTTTPEEMEAKHTRVVMSSLQGLSWVLQLTYNYDATNSSSSTNNNGDVEDSGANSSSKKAKEGKITEALLEVVGNAAFWKLAKSKDSTVRLAWFDLIGDLLATRPQVLVGSQADLTPAMLTTLDDPTGPVCVAVWKVFLRWNTLDQEWRSSRAAKSSTNRVLQVLREGGRGGGGALYSLLPPLLSLLTPEEDQGEGGGGGGGEEGGGGGKRREVTEEFYINFLRAVSTGILKHPGRAVHGGGATGGVTALFQCLRQLAPTTTATGAGDGGSGGQLWATLLEYQVVGMLSAAFTSTPAVFSSSSLYVEVKKLLHLLSTSSSDLLDVFWGKFVKMMEDVILAEGEDGGERSRMERISRVSSFLLTLFSSEPQKKKKKSLRFKDEVEEKQSQEEEEEDKLTSEHSPSKEIQSTPSKPVPGWSVESPDKCREVPQDAPTPHAFLSAGERGMALLAALCQARFDQKGDVGAYSLLASIVRALPCPSVYRAMLRVEEAERELETERKDGGIMEETEEKVEGVCEVTAREVLQRRIVPRFQRFSSSSSSSSSSLLPPTMEIFTSLYSQLTEEERKKVLEGLEPSLHVTALHPLIKILSSFRPSDTPASEWLSSAVLCQRTTLLADDLCRVTLDPSVTVLEAEREKVAKLLEFLLGSGERRGPVVGAATVAGVLNSLGRSLLAACSSSSSSSSLEEMARLTSSLADIEPSHPSWHSPGARHFLQALFTALCHSLDSATTTTTTTTTILRGTLLKIIKGVTSASAKEGQGSVKVTPESATNETQKDARNGSGPEIANTQNGTSYHQDSAKIDQKSAGNDQGSAGNDPKSTGNDQKSAGNIQASARNSQDNSEGQKSAGKDQDSAEKSPKSAGKSQDGAGNDLQSAKNKVSILLQALRDIRAKIIGHSCSYDLATFLADLTLDLLALGQPTTTTTTTTTTTATSTTTDSSTVAPNSSTQGLESADAASTTDSGAKTDIESADCSTTEIGTDSGTIAPHSDTQESIESAETTTTEVGTDSSTEAPVSGTNEGLESAETTTAGVGTDSGTVAPVSGTQERLEGARANTTGDATNSDSLPDSGTKTPDSGTGASPANSNISSSQHSGTQTLDPGTRTNLQGASSERAPRFNTTNLAPKFGTAIDSDSIALDDTHIQALLEEVALTEGDWADLECHISPLYVAPSILKTEMAFREFPFPRHMSQCRPWDHRHHRAALFTLGVLNGLCECQSAEGVSLGRYTHLFVCVLHSAVSASMLLGHAKASCALPAVSEDVGRGISRLVNDTRAFLGRLNLGNKRLIAKQVRDRCSDGSSAWSVTLGQALTTWLTPHEVNAPRLLHGLHPDDLGHTTTKQALLPLLPEATLLDIVAEEAACLSSLAEEPFCAPPALALLSSALPLLPSSAEEVKEAVAAIFGVLFQWRERADGVFLFAEDLEGVVWEDLAVVCAVVRVVSVCVQHHPRHLQAQHWDFTLCCLSSWVQSLQESLKSIQEETVAGAFTYSVCVCVRAVAELMAVLGLAEEVAEGGGAVGGGGGGGGGAGEAEEAGASSTTPPTTSPTTPPTAPPTSPTPSSFPPKLVEDWREFFAPPIFDSLINIYVNLAKAYQESPNTLLHGVCSAVSAAVCSANQEALARHSLPPAPVLTLKNEDEEEEEEEGGLSESEELLLRHLASLLVSSHPAVQGASYCLLRTALPSIVSSWEARVTRKKQEEEEEEEEDEEVKKLPTALLWVLKQVKEGEAGAWGAGGEVPPSDPMFPRVVGYLMGWKLTFSALILTPDLHQHQYCAFLRERGLLPALLHNLFTLMPLRPLAGGDDKTNTATFFTSDLDIKPLGTSSALFPPRLACSVYYGAVSAVPAAVRQWFVALDRHSQTAVDAFTAAYVSPILIQQEMAAVTDSSAKFDNMTVRCRTGAREVVAAYTVDEAKMELVLRMAPNHPLGTVTVEDHKRIGVPLAQWRNWLLGLTTMLSHRNTPLLRSLAFWKQNIDHKFKGLEECYICYYVIHGTNHQLPRLLCRTCKKKFHSACLYKWFNSSNNSTCPLCRSLF